LASPKSAPNLYDLGPKNKEELIFKKFCQFFTERSEVTPTISDWYLW